MRRALALVIALLFIGQIQAGDKKPLTAERVGQLLTILRSDLNEENRAHAAAELGKADGTRNPEVVFLLIEALKADPKPSVRAEVVDSLSKIRPITREAGQALDAAKEDGSFKVRWHARTAVRVYHTAGYGEQENKVAATPGKSSANGPRPGSDGTQTKQSAGLLANMFSKPATQSDSVIVNPKQSVIFTPKQPVVMPESPKTGGLLASWANKSSTSSEPIIVQQPKQPVVAPPTTQSGGWLYHMMARPNSTTKTPASGNEPPLAQPVESSTPRTTTAPTGLQSTSNNPYGDIPSAPATPGLQPKMSPYMPQKPLIPQLPDKQGQD